MKILLLFLLLCIGLDAQAQTNKIKTYKADLQKSNFQWTGYAEAGGYAPTGTINLKQATLQLKNGIPFSAKVIIQMSTLTHENKDLEGHLKKEDFFDTEKFPLAIFELTKITGNKAVGNLTIKGVTHKITVPFTLKTDKNALIYDFQIKINRTKFGIKYNSSSYFQDLGSYAIKNEFLLVGHLAFEGKD